VVEAALRFDNKNAVALYGRGFVKNKRDERRDDKTSLMRPS